jgi:hypothetical protein
MTYHLFTAVKFAKPDHLIKKNKIKIKNKEKSKEKKTKKENCDGRSI